MFIRKGRSKTFIIGCLITSMVLSLGQLSLALAIGIENNLKKVTVNQSKVSNLRIKGIAGRDYAAGELIVKFKAPKNSYSANKLAKVQVLKTIQNKKVQLVKINNQADFMNTMETYKNNPDVEYVQPNYITRPYFTPNDSMYKEQWALAKMKLPEAWDIAQGYGDVTVAILDSGVDLDHPDLASSIVSGTDIIDVSLPPDDDNGHGTHVAGIVAAIANNFKGISGIAGGAKIMPVKVLRAEGIGYSFDIYYGIKWAVDHGANIINMSIGVDSADPVLEEAINYAHDKGVIVVAAAGNEDSNVSYPAAYNHVIAVAATDENDKRAYFSNYGPEIDVSAPGVNILSSTPNHPVYDKQIYLNYDYMSGTSMASPQVAGLAALILSKNHNLTPDQVENIIKQSADDLGTPGYDNYYGYGRINALKALSSVSMINDNIAPTGSFKINSGNKITMSAAITINLEGIVDTSKVTEMQFSNDGLQWSQWESYAPTKNWNLADGDGFKRVYVKFADGVGNESYPLSETIILDTYKPIVKLVTPMYTNLVSSNTTFKVSWSANDLLTSSGIKSFDIEYREGGTINWVNWKTNYTGLNASFIGRAGKTYYFRGRAKDAAGNIGNWTTLNYETIVPYDNDSIIAGRIGFSYTYNNSSSQNYLGTYRYSKKANDQISYKFVGNKVALIGLKGLGLSKGKIYIDNVYKGTVDEYASTTKYRQIIYSTYWKTKGTHVIKVVNLGTSGRGNFKIDGIAVGK